MCISPTSDYLNKELLELELELQLSPDLRAGGGKWVNFTPPSAAAYPPSLMDLAIYPPPHSGKWVNCTPPSAEAYPPLSAPLSGLTLG